MTLTHIRRGGFLACITAAALVIGGGAGVAHADDQPGNRPEQQYRQDPVDMGYDAALSDDALITDDMEAQVVPPGPDGNPVCSNESIQTGVNPTPSAPSFQLMYVVPSDVTANSALDVPQSCSNGTVKYSAIARGSRNMATWLANQNVGLNYRTMTITYTHNYTGSQYSTRGVRRFKSASSRATWESLAMYNKTDGSSPRNAKLRKDLIAAGFSTSSTKYMAVLDASGQQICSTCGSYVGIAEQGGTYGMTVRSQKSSTGTLVTIRYGCAVDGDSIFAHEATHELGAPHVTDYANDLMQATKPKANFNTSPALVWDYGRNSYDATVRASAYVSLANVTGTYFTC